MTEKKIKIRDIMYKESGSLPIGWQDPKNVTQKVVREICKQLTDNTKIVSAINKIIPPDYEMYLEDFDPEAPRIGKGDLEFNFLLNMIMDMEL